MTTAIVLEILNAALGLTGVLRALGINYQEVLDAQKAEGGKLSPETVQKFLDQSQVAIDEL